jgi:hypothetical protein
MNDHAAWSFLQVPTGKGLYMTGRVMESPVRRPFAGVDEIGNGCNTTLPSTCELDWASSASAMGLGCARGTTFALVLEGAFGLLVYGLWHLLR